MKRTRDSLLLALILLLGLVLRAAAMTGRSFMGDEVSVAVALERPFGELFRSFGGPITQPLYILVAKACRETLTDVVGIELALRLPSLVFGLLGIAVIAALGRRLFGPATGLWAALLLAVHPFHQFYSQMALGYALAGTLALGSVLALLRFAESRRTRDGLLYFALTTASLYCHLGYLGVVLAQVLALPFLIRGAPLAVFVRVLLPLALGCAAGLALYLPALASLLEFREQWSAEEGRLPPELFPFVLTALAGGSGLRIYVYLGVGLLGLWLTASRPRTRRYAPLLLLWPAGVFCFYLANGAAQPPWAFGRFFHVALPAVVLPAALGVEALCRALAPGGSLARRALAGAALLILAGSILPRTAEVAWGGKGTPWPAVIAHLQTEVPRDALLISMPMRFNGLANYFHPQAEQVPEALLEFRASLANVDLERPLVFLVDLVPFDDPTWAADFTRTRFGDTTVLMRASGPATEQRALLDLQRVTREVLGYLNSRPDPHEWIYWKLDEEHHSLFDKRRLNRQYSVFLETAQERLHGRRPPEREHKVQAVYPPFRGLLIPRLTWR